MGKYFGTDGIRGKFGGEFINPDFAYRVGSALGCFLAQKNSSAGYNVIIGRDTRISGSEICDALTRGLNAHGVFVHDTGIVPTPAVAQSVIEQHADLGITITASHNPASDNGIKLFNSKGHKYDDAVEAQIEALIDAEPNPPKELPLPKSYPLDGASFYINYLRSLMDQNCMRSWSIVLDTANGATCETSPSVFKRWGATLHLIGDNPDGENINSGVGSEYPVALGESVRSHGANIGIAHDGDGDRLVVCDEKGDVVDGDVLLGIFGLHALRSGALKQNTLVATIQSNLGLDDAIRQAGGKVERVDIGDRNVASKMREIGSNIGGENSGHIIFSDFASTGDGLLAAVKLIDLMCKTHKTLSELTQEITLFPQKTLNLKVEEKLPLESLPQLTAAIEQVESAFGEEGRVLVRYSGTEPKLRLLVEGKIEKDVLEALAQIEKAVRQDLTVIDD
ncbi:MAG: phosphoglucosamine mutase [Opitutales bacterium]|jgi:phosphoglucosamine mutase|nr:phosphoglucosamine mutase [Opitutales bacterium]MDP4645452.1 phosphoglucosamine mutase [Opitutales bacterium]MDP4778206.1 phosphoglucosamine mutase [Opitutales bacterium]MDP4880026.1 phosphoglucosamine mutase [Opitutales bacterium]MDP4883669.1 phosphoglucosamine mutase [Opitutales bacterium]